MAFAIVLQLERLPKARVRADLATPLTPVLSARRVPLVLAAPVADRRLSDRLNAFLSRSPGPVCLLVTADGRAVYADQPGAPMTPASLEKLLTGAAALDRLGSGTRLRTDIRAV